MKKTKLFALLSIIIFLVSSLSAFIVYEASFSYYEVGPGFSMGGWNDLVVNKTEVWPISVEEGSPKRAPIFYWYFDFRWESDWTLRFQVLNADQYSDYRGGKSFSTMFNKSARSGQFKLHYQRPNIDFGKYYVLVSVDRVVENILDDSDYIHFHCTRFTIGQYIFWDGISCFFYDAGLKPFYVFRAENEIASKDGTLAFCLPIVPLIIFIVLAIIFGVLSRRYLKKMRNEKKDDAEKNGKDIPQPKK